MRLNNVTITALAALALSVSFNGFLYWQNEKWKAAFYDQVGVLADIEMLFRESEADTSYEAMLALSKELFGDSVAEIKAGSIHAGFGADERAIQLVNAKVLFKDGEYYGTEVHLPGD